MECSHDKSGFLLCTENHGQPIRNEKGKLLYYCTKTGALTIFDDESSHKASMNESINQIERETTANEDLSSELNVAEKTETTSEDKFTYDMTLKLLEIVQSKFHLLNDKMHSKKKIWANIATEMQKNDYLTTYGTKGADKCHQRWRNLEKIYHGHCRYMKSTGTGKKKPPKYFNEMHELIGEKHSSKPVNLRDSLDISTASTSNKCSGEISDEAIDDENILDLEDPLEKIKEKENLKSTNIFENVKKSVRPKIENVSTVLRELHTQDTKIENERFEKFQTLLVEQNEMKKRTLDQRDEFLTIMKNIYNLEARKQSKKRKHSFDSD